MPEEETQVEVGRQLPMYKSHKEVWAFKIERIKADYDIRNERNEEREATSEIHLIGQGFDIKVKETYVTKHNPQVGGYYVYYKDGYESFSPAEAFEEGYTRV